LKEQGYFARAAQAVFSDGTWWWRALAIGAVSLVPYVGTIIILGYFMVLMRGSAWGADTRLPRFSDVREILRRALDGFVVSLVWGLVIAVPLVLVIVTWVFTTVAQRVIGSVPVLPWWWVYAYWVPAVALSVFMNVAVLRAAVYLKPTAGLSLSGVSGLVKRAPAGFRRVSVLAVSASAFALLLRTPITLMRYVPQIPAPALTYGWGLVAGAASAVLSFVVYVAYGLWAKDTDPSTWPPLGEPVVIQYPSLPTDLPLPASPPVESPSDVV
jgi:hypothetical protein